MAKSSSPRLLLDPDVIPSAVRAYEHALRHVHQSTHSPPIGALDLRRRIAKAIVTAAFLTDQADEKSLRVSGLLAVRALRADNRV